MVSSQEPSLEGTQEILREEIKHGQSPSRGVPWRKWQPTPEFLPGESHGQRSLVGYSSWSHKELDMTKQLNNNKHKFIPYLCKDPTSP